MQKNYKRRIYYIKNSAQGHFIFRFLMISLMGGIGAVSVFNILASKKIDTVLYSMRMPKISPGGLLWNEMLYSNIFVIIFTMLVFAITARGLYIKVNGPLKKITSDINRMADGDLTLEICLREDDEFKDFAADLNQVTYKLRQTFNTIKEANQEIIKLTSDEQPEYSANKLPALNDAVSRLENAVGSFKI